jgi:hypothetical protein
MSFKGGAWDSLVVSLYGNLKEEFCMCNIKESDA